jgi:ornithine carbamoyltransferase
VVTVADWPPDLLSVADLPCVALEAALDRAADMKRAPARWQGALAGETVACLSAQPALVESARTATAAHRLGMLAVVLPHRLDGDDQSVEDAGRDISTSAAAVVTYAVGKGTLRRFATAATIPVINGASDEHRPCQALADLLTLRERFGELAGVAIAILGDARGAAVNSLLEGAALCGMDVRVACPPDCRPSRLIEVGAEALAGIHGARLTVTEDPEAAVAGADAVYTTTWSVSGNGDQRAQRARLRRYRVEPALMKRAHPGAILLHPLPVRRGEEVAAYVIDGDRSAVWHEAANRVPAEQAAIYSLVVANRATAGARAAP